VGEGDRAGVKRGYRKSEGKAEFSTTNSCIIGVGMENGKFNVSWKTQGKEEKWGGGIKKTKPQTVVHL